MSLESSRHSPHAAELNTHRCQTPARSHAPEISGSLARMCSALDILGLCLGGSAPIDRLCGPFGAPRARMARPCKWEVRLPIFMMGNPSSVKICYRKT